MPIINWQQPDDKPREDPVKHPILRVSAPSPTRPLPPIMAPQKEKGTPN